VLLLSTSTRSLTTDLGAFLLPGNDLFDADGGLDGHDDTVLATIPCLADFLGHVFWDGWEVEVGLLVSTFVHEGELFALNVDDLPVGTVDDGHGGSVGGWDHIFQLLSGEDVDGGEVTLGVTVLSGLGDGDAQNLAWLSLDHDESSLLDLTSFHRDGSRGTGIGGLDLVIIIGHI